MQLEEKKPRAAGRPQIQTGLAEAVAWTIGDEAVGFDRFPEEGRALLPGHQK